MSTPAFRSADPWDHSVAAMTEGPGRCASGENVSKLPDPRLTKGQNSVPTDLAPDEL